MTEQEKLEQAAEELPRIGHNGDAVALLDEMIEESNTFLDAGSFAAGYYLPRFEALRDAIARGIV